MNELISNEQMFHGEFYTEDPWSSPMHECCNLCKTRNSTGKYKHWAKGLCRSCYRRLSVTHRLYNDRWNSENSGSVLVRKSMGKKTYKSIDPNKIIFDPNDISCLLDRYHWKCAYSKIALQGYDHRRGDAFQLEYYISNDETVMLVPVCRQVNCSKKSLNEETELRKWALQRGLIYPFTYITLEDFTG